jgi:hypothetical protein
MKVVAERRWWSCGFRFVDLSANCHPERSRGTLSLSFRLRQCVLDTRSLDCAAIRFANLLLRSG